MKRLVIRMLRKLLILYTDQARQTSKQTGITTLSIFIYFTRLSIYTH